MLDFPKKYKETKTYREETKNHPFFFLPEKYKNSFDIDQIYTLILIDVFYYIIYGEHISGSSFLPNPLINIDDFEKNEGKTIRLLKKQLKKFGLFSFIDGLKSPKDLDFTFKIQQLFAEHLRIGNIFEDRFLVYRSSKYQTPVSEDNIRKIPSQKKRYNIKYFVSTKNHSLDLYTTDPETIFGDVAIAIHPQHKKAKALNGQLAIIPIINKTIPIIIDERADFTRDGGVFRVTPGHNKIGLAIAKDHNLPIDVYAIDENGLFTDNAGIFSKKPVNDFLKNIIQSLSDIGNLTNIENIDGNNFFGEDDDDQLSLRNWKGFFIKIPEDNIDSFFANDSISELGINQEYINSGYRIASANYKQGIPIPIWEHDSGYFVFDAKLLEEFYIKSGAKSGFVIGLIIQHLISNQIIPEVFSIDILISEILKQQKLDDNAFKKLITTIQNQFPNKKEECSLVLKYIENLNKENVSEKNIETIFDIIDGLFCLEKEKHGLYKFAFDRISDNFKNPQKYRQSISHNFINMILLLEKIKKANGEKLIITIKEDMLKSVIKNILFINNHLGENFINKINTIKPLINQKKWNQNTGNILSEIKNYHIDCIRLSMILMSNGENQYDPTFFKNTDKLISTFWNVCRYVKTEFLKDNDKIFLKDIQTNLENNIDDFSIFDAWIISKFDTIIEEKEQLKTPDQIGIFIKKTFDFIQDDFSSKYLELIKSAPSNHSANICLYIIGTLLSITLPYIPNITKELRTIFGFNQNIKEITILKSFAKIQKNYSISLFMEIIDKFSVMKAGLNLKKHDMISIFIRSNPDFIKFIKSNESLFKKTLHAEEIIYLIHHEETPCGYIKEDIIDISIGLKALSKPSISGIALLQKQLEDKEEYLQHIKHLIQQLSNSGADDDVIQQKKDEISKIKNDIDDLNFEISKCKMRD